MTVLPSFLPALADLMPARAPMSLDTFLVFLPACFALNLAFGPNNLLALTNGARGGVSTAVGASVGRLAAFVIMIAITAIGLGAVLTASEVAFSVVKFAGAAYLVWLGVKILRARAPIAALVGVAEKRPMASLQRQEFWVAAGNPKAILIFTAFFPQFVNPQAYAGSFVVISATFLALEIVGIAAYGALGARFSHMLDKGRVLKWFNRSSGAMMVGFGILLALTRRPAA
ncbi:LysE family translocator [Pseudoxanthobacter sp.]|uniref:LysE family translocator n=1 Tax=Pseudoxanthobacter sp. TaxID=1925742 RepID=UPI002FE1B712